MDIQNGGFRMKQVEEQKQKSNTCGIIGIPLGFFIPLAGLVLGIIALHRKEKTQAIGIVAICVSVVMWIVNIFLLI